MSIFRRGRPEQAARHGRGGERRAAETSSDPAADEAGERTGPHPNTEPVVDAESRVQDRPAMASEPRNHSDDVAARGPFDREDVHSLNGRLDLGSLWITGVPGMELRLEIEEESGQLVGATAVIGESALQMQAFAAPKTVGIWDEVRDELAQKIATGGGTAEEAEGPMGTELLTRTPTAGPDGRTVFAAARCIGVDGPRWFLRAVLSGRAAIDDAAAEPLMDVLRRVVVVRGVDPMAPREVLPLTLPDQIRPEAPPAQPEALGPFERGPEITEVR